MSTIVPNYRTIKVLLDKSSFSIDEYQREYKWGRKNIEELVSDLREKFFSSYREGDDPSAVSQYDDYFLGSIIVSNRNNTSYLVDGQQRITSLTLLLIYLYRVALDKASWMASNLQGMIYSDNYGNPAFNLDIPERLSVVEALFYGDDFNPDGKDESIQTMYERYQDIAEIDLASDLGEALPHFCYWLMNRVGLIEIGTDSDASARTIFETMNDRGKPLSPVDMLKAYLLAPIDEREHRRAANQLWKREMLALTSWAGEHEADRDATFFKAWFRAQYADSIRERRADSTNRDWELVGTAFHRWARDKRATIGIGNQKENLHFINGRLPFYSRAYRRILDASEQYLPGLEPVFYNAHNAFTWQNTVLLAPLHENDSDDVVDRKIAVTARYLDIWLMRRVVNYTRVSYSSSSYAMYLLCKEARQLPLPELVELLIKRLNEDDFSFEGSTSRDRHGIEDLRLNQFSKRYIYHLLARVTAYVEVESGGSDRFAEYVDRTLPNPYDIEHLWANHFSRHRDQFDDSEEFRSWRDNAAGLVLIPADVNRSYGAKPFEEKVIHYTKQNLYAASLAKETYQHAPQFQAFQKRENLDFEPYSVFGKEEQLQRRQLLKELALRVWAPEQLRDHL